MKLIENLSIASAEEYLIGPKDWDIFISCGSFEERCARSSEILLSRHVRIGSSIIFNYKETDPERKKEENIQKMKDNLKQISRYTHVHNSESVSLPGEGMRKFLTFLDEKRIHLAQQRIIVDVTVFTKAYFFLLFKVLRERFGLTTFDIFYTEPEKYKGKNSDKNEIILTEGLDRVESIPGFVGSSVNSKEVLIVILGYEGKRAMDVFYTVNPEITYAINGFPSYHPGGHKISLEANLRFMQESGASGKLYFAPAVDPFETRKVISEIIVTVKEKYADSNITIAPLGTKMQAFGVLLYALHDETVKVVYPFPSIYKPDYSYKYGPSRIFRVNLNKLAR